MAGAHGHAYGIFSMEALGWRSLPASQKCIAIGFSQQEHVEGLDVGHFGPKVTILRTLRDQHVQCSGSHKGISKPQVSELNSKCRFKDRLTNGRAVGDNQSASSHLISISGTAGTHELCTYGALPAIPLGKSWSSSSGVIKLPTVVVHQGVERGRQSWRTAAVTGSPSQGREGSLDAASSATAGASSERLQGATGQAPMQPNQTKERRQSSWEKCIVRTQRQGTRPWLLKVFNRPTFDVHMAKASQNGWPRREDHDKRAGGNRQSRPLVCRPREYVRPAAAHKRSSPESDRQSTRGPQMPLGRDTQQGPRASWLSSGGSPIRSPSRHSVPSVVASEASQGPSNYSRFSTPAYCSADKRVQFGCSSLDSEPLSSDWNRPSRTTQGTGVQSVPRLLGTTPAREAGHLLIGSQTSEEPEWMGKLAHLYAQFEEALEMNLTTNGIPGKWRTATECLNSVARDADLAQAQLQETVRWLDQGPKPCPTDVQPSLQPNDSMPTKKITNQGFYYWGSLLNQSALQSRMLVKCRRNVRIYANRQRQVEMSSWCELYHASNHAVNYKVMEQPYFGSIGSTLHGLQDEVSNLQAQNMVANSKS